jgi:hypothetical protein
VDYCKVRVENWVWVIVLKLVGDFLWVTLRTVLGICYSLLCGEVLKNVMG